MTGKAAGRLMVTAVFGGALLLGGAQSAAAQAGDVQFRTAAGDVRCDVVGTAQGPHVTCVSEGARAAMPQCNPPAELIPAVQVRGTGPGQVLCWNQGLTGVPRVLQPGELGNAHGVTVVADPLGGLHVLSPDLNYIAYAGPGAVGTSVTAGSSAGGSQLA